MLSGSLCSLSNCAIFASRKTGFEQAPRHFFQDKNDLCKLKENPLNSDHQTRVKKKFSLGDQSFTPLVAEFYYIGGLLPNERQSFVGG